MFHNKIEYGICMLTLILGPPGCGKTTLLKALAGKLQDPLKVGLNSLVSHSKIRNIESNTRCMPTNGSRWIYIWIDWVMPAVGLWYFLVKTSCRICVSLSFCKDLVNLTSTIKDIWIIEPRPPPFILWDKTYPMIHILASPQGQYHPFECGVNCQTHITSS